jgi:hypothetical protein
MLKSFVLRAETLSTAGASERETRVHGVWGRLRILSIHRVGVLCHWVARSDSRCLRGDRPMVLVNLMKNWKKGRIWLMSP